MGVLADFRLMLFGMLMLTVVFFIVLALSKCGLLAF